MSDKTVISSYERCARFDSDYRRKALRVQIEFGIRFLVTVACQNSQANHSLISICNVVVVAASPPHQSPRCGASRFRSALSITIPLSVWSASISPAH